MEYNKPGTVQSLYRDGGFVHSNRSIVTDKGDNTNNDGEHNRSRNKQQQHKINQTNLIKLTDEIIINSYPMEGQ